MIAGVEVYSQKYLPVLWNVTYWQLKGKCFHNENEKSDCRPITTVSVFIGSRSAATPVALLMLSTGRNQQLTDAPRAKSALNAQDRFCLGRRQNRIIIRANLLMFRIWLRRALLSCLRTQSQCTCHRLRCHYTAPMTTPSTTENTQTHTRADFSVCTVTVRKDKSDPVSIAFSQLCNMWHLPPFHGAEPAVSLRPALLDGRPHLLHNLPLSFRLSDQYQTTLLGWLNTVQWLQIDWFIITKWQQLKNISLKIMIQK